MMRFLVAVFSVALLLFLPFKSVAIAGSAAPLLLIDAHSQLPSSDVAPRVLPLMNQAGISGIILSFRQAQPQDVLELARQSPERVFPAIRLKGPGWGAGGDFEQSVQQQLATGRFKALGEALLYHARKGKRAPQITQTADSEQFALALEIAKSKHWPLILHFEFRANPDQEYKQMLDDILTDNPSVAFPLIHMGQLDASEAADLIAHHRNVYFMTSHANPISTATSAQPWTNMFSGNSLKQEWMQLMIAYPDRFIFALDNVFPEHWGEIYARQADLWRAALSTLPRSVAEKIGHQNAERLWHLPRARAIAS